MNNNPNTYTFVTGHYNKTLPTGGSNSLSTTSNTFYLSGLSAALYRVRVRSINNNGEQASAWSDVIGTGARADHTQTPAHAWNALGWWGASLWLCTASAKQSRLIHLSLTGAIDDKKPASVNVEDGEDSLAVTFDTVAGALG